MGQRLHWGPDILNRLEEIGRNTRCWHRQTFQNCDFKIQEIKQVWIHGSTQNEKTYAQQSCHPVEGSGVSSPGEKSLTVTHLAEN